MHGIDASDWSAFTAAFSGTVMERGDDGFAEARARVIWNGNITRQPAVIVQPASAEDVAIAVSFTRAQRLDLTVRGGGHSFAGHAVAEDGFLIDLSRLDHVTVDSAARRARCGGGTTWAQLDAATAAHGLAVPGGTISHTGVAGLTLGGGMGWLTQRAGLSCDNLVSAQVVTADGRIVHASAEEHPDLLWALRGGGGNFGIVTDFEFHLHEVSPMANLGLFFWAAGDAAEPLRFLREYAAAVPDDFGFLLAALSAPPAPFIPPEHHGKVGFAALVVNWGPAEQHTAVIGPLRANDPLFEFVTELPYVALQQMLDENAPWGFHGYEKALYVPELTDEVIDTLVQRVPRKTSPLTFMPIFRLDGAYTAVDDDETAFGGRRYPQWVVNAAAIAATAEELEADRAWARDLWSALLPYAPDNATYVNFLADADDTVVAASYGAAKYRRLAAIKAEWDPENLFHHNANIRPVTAGAALPEQRAAATETPAAEPPPALPAR